MRILSLSSPIPSTALLTASSLGAPVVSNLSDQHLVDDTSWRWDAPVHIHLSWLFLDQQEHGRCTLKRRAFLPPNPSTVCQPGIDVVIILRARSPCRLETRLGVSRLDHHHRATPYFSLPSRALWTKDAPRGHGDMTPRNLYTGFTVKGWAVGSGRWECPAGFVGVLAISRASREINGTELATRTDIHT